MYAWHLYAQYVLLTLLIWQGPFLASLCSSRNLKMIVENDCLGVCRYSSLLRTGRMIKIISYIVIAFFLQEGKYSMQVVQYSTHFQREQRPVSRLQISLIRMKPCIASHSLWAVAMLKSLLCLKAGPLQDYCGSSIYEHTALCVSFNWLTTCTWGTAQWLGHCWRGLTQTELAYW